ncbi:hypothetical protein BH23PSE1_BH23PSE1_13060 [soil metagenome]
MRLRLETFTPAADPAAARAAAADARLIAAREEGYAAGFIAGQAEATEAHAGDEARLSSALVEALQDGQLTNEAARRASIAGLLPIVGKLFGAVAPSLADAAMAGEIARRVERRSPSCRRHARASAARPSLRRCSRRCSPGGGSRRR